MAAHHKLGINMFIDVWKSNGFGPISILKSSLADYLAKGFTTENPKQRKKREKPEPQLKEESPPSPTSLAGVKETRNKQFRNSQQS